MRLCHKPSKRRFFIGFNLLNGIGYLCVGNMVMDLIAIRLHFPDIVLSMLSAIFNIGCLWIPLGKVATEKWGAARTQSNFWILRNFAAIMMGSCAIWGYFGQRYIACAFMLIGAFIFYGCRSAGGVMSSALVGNITHENERGKLLAFASMAHNITTAIVVIALTVVLGVVEHLSGDLVVWALFGIVLFGATCGILSAVCLRCIDESDAIQKAAKKPLIADAWVCLKDSGFRRMVIGELCGSLGMALTLALNTLVLTRGLNVPSSWLMALSFISSFMYVALARPASILGDKIGPRKAIIIGFCFNFLIVLFWMVIPKNYHWYQICGISVSPGIIIVALILYFLTACCSMCCGICQGQYFLKCIPVEHQPSAATLQQFINGVLTGFIAMGLTAMMWWLCDHLGPELTGLARYRLFFLLGLPFLGVFGIGVWMRKEV